MRFVAYLYWKRRFQPRSPWVERAELCRVLPQTTDKQLQRYVDHLYKSGFDILEYRTKTRGPWRFTLAPEQVSTDADEPALLAWLGFSPEQLPDNDRQVLPQLKLANALLQTFVHEAAFRNRGLDQHDELPAALQTYQQLAADSSLPPLIRAGLLQRQCMLCRQTQHFSAWRQALNALEALVQGGQLQSSDFAARSLLLQAFWHYDQQQFAEAAALLERIKPDTIRDTLTLGRYHNMVALMLLRQVRGGLAGQQESVARPAAALTRQLHLAQQALEQAITLAVMVDDYWGLEGMCFNYGNLLWITRELAEPTALPVVAAARWVGLCEQICAGFGVGGNSAWSRLLLGEMAIDQQWSLAELNTHASLIISADADLEAMLLATLEDARRRGSLPEEAAATALLARLYASNNRRALGSYWQNEAASLQQQTRRPAKPRRPHGDE